MATYWRLQTNLCRQLRGCSKNNLRVWGEMWTEESRKMWGCAQNWHWRDPQASPNSNWRKHSLQSLPWTIRPWIHANRSQDYWFHRPCIISMKQSLKLRTLDSGINIGVRLLIFGFFFRGLRPYSREWSIKESLKFCYLMKWDMFFQEAMFIVFPKCSRGYLYSRGYAYFRV